MSRAARLGWALSRSAFGYRCSLVLSVLDPSVISPLFWGDGIPRLSVLSCHCCSPSGRPCTSLGPRPCPSPLCAALVGPGICERDGGSRGDEGTSSPRVCFLVSCFCCSISCHPNDEMNAERGRGGGNHTYYF